MSMGAAAIDNLQAYTELKANTFLAAADIDDRLDFSKLLEQAALEIKGRTTESLKLGAAGGVAVDMLSLALRLLVGCGAKQDAAGALQLLVPLASPGSARVQRGVEARANSVLASFEADCALEEMPDCMNIDALVRAGTFANNAAALGLVSPTVLFVGKRLSDFGARSRAAWKLDWLYPPKLEKLEFLWEALDRRDAEMAREMQARDKKVAKRPTAYRCAAPGCGIVATRKAALLRCSGGCETKAHYCSKECQSEDWKRHKRACRPGNGATTSTTAPQDPGRVAPSSVTSDQPVGDEIGDGKERSIVINVPSMPGGQVTVSSTTMGPAALRQLRDARS